MTITEECFQRDIYTRRDIYTKISVILPGTKAALVLCEPKVESRRRRAEIYLAARRDFVFVGAKGEKKKGKKQGGGRAIFSMRRVTRETRGNDRIKRALSRCCVLACETHTSRHRRWRARSASSAGARVLTDEAWHTHVRDECVLEIRTLFPRELRVDERGMS